MERARVMAAMAECRRAVNEGHAPDGHGQYFSGFDVARQLGVRHEEVWQTIRDLDDAGLVRGAGT